MHDSLLDVAIPPAQWWLRSNLVAVSHDEHRLYHPNCRGIEIKSFPMRGKKPMLKKVTNLIKGLQQPLKNYVRLGWVEIEDDEFIVTEDGRDAKDKVDFGLVAAKDLAEYAKQEVARIKSEAKEEGEDE